MNIFKKKISTFEIILLIFIIFFSIILFLSIPALFDYERYKDKIKNQIFVDYKIHLSNIGKINYNFLPAPHLKIENATFSLDKEKNVISEIKNLEMYISFYFLVGNENIKHGRAETPGAGFPSSSGSGSSSSGSTVGWGLGFFLRNVFLYA